MDHINAGNIRQSAFEMITLIRYFDLLIDDFVSIGKSIWDLYLTMLKVVDIVLSTSLEESCCVLLETLIGKINELYIKYSKNTLKPKFHFLTRYPLIIIRKFGPVVHFWSMRYEAKHRISKISARSSFNRPNICKTLAIKHQLQLNDIFTKGLLCNSLVIGPSKILNCSKYNLIKSEFNLSTEETLIHISWAELKGTRYTND